MTVAELIAALENVPQDMPVYAGTKASRYVFTIDSVDGNVIQFYSLPERVLPRRSTPKREPPLNKYRKKR